MSFAQWEWTLWGEVGSLILVLIELCNSFCWRLPPAFHSLYISVQQRKYNSLTSNKEPRNVSTIYAAMIYTAPCKMFWMRAYPLQEEVGGVWALEFSSFLGPVQCHRDDRHVPFGAQKLENSRAQPPPTFPSNGYARIQNIMYRAV
jgi:hypothetical protein